MKITILGVGDVEDILDNSKIGKEKLERLIEELAEFLAHKKHEIIIQPAKGIPYEIASKYKKKGGKKVIGAVSPNCPYYGKFYDLITGKYRNICDEFQEFHSWYDVDGNLATSGDATLCLGFSTGVLTEICEMKYNIKYLGRKTKLFIFKNTISRVLKEIKPDLQAVYISSVKELEKELKKLKP
jgi:hypothetical protein